MRRCVAYALLPVITLVAACSFGRDDDATAAGLAEADRITSGLGVTALGTVLATESWGAVGISGDAPTRLTVVATDAPDDTRARLEQQLRPPVWTRVGACPPGGSCLYQGNRDGRFVTVTLVPLARGGTYPVENRTRTLPGRTSALLVRVTAKP